MVSKAAKCHIWRVGIDVNSWCQKKGIIMYLLYSFFSSGRRLCLKNWCGSLGRNLWKKVLNNYFFYISSTNWKIRTSSCILFHTFLIYSCRTELLPLILLAIPFLKLEILSFVQKKKKMQSLDIGSNFTSHHHSRGIPMIFWNNCTKLEWIILRKSGHAPPLKTLSISKFTTLNLPYPDNSY